MRIEQLRYFVQIIESGSFNKAAKKLYITQPALTSSINALEEELHLKLLKRSNRGVIPTPKGIEFYRDSLNILNEFITMRNKWLDVSTTNTLSGNVHVAGIPALINLVLDSTNIDMRRIYPDITIQFHEIMLNDFITDFPKSISNIGITVLRNDQKSDIFRKLEKQDLDYFDLYEDAYEFVISTKSPIAHQEALTQDQCKELNLVMLSNDNITYKGYRELFGTTTIVSNRENVLQMVAEEQAITLLLKRASRNNFYIKNGLCCLRPLYNELIHPSTHCLISLNDELLSKEELAVKYYLINNYDSIIETP